MLSAERVRAGLLATRFVDIRIVAEVDSTNRVVRDLADAGGAEGLVVVAEHQTAGKGRLGRTWEAPARSAILASVLLRPALAGTERYLVTAAMALSAREACATVAGFRPQLKWPNDLVAGDAKVAGILAQASSGAVVAGIGINVSASPPDADHLDALTGAAVDRTDLLLALLGDLHVRLMCLEAVLDDYRAACATIGRDVRVAIPGGALVGRAVGVDDLGRLVVTPAQGAAVAVAAGDVTHVRTR